MLIALLAVGAFAFFVCVLLVARRTGNDLAPRRFKPIVVIADKPRERLLDSAQIVRHLSNQAKGKS